MIARLLLATLLLSGCDLLGTSEADPADDAEVGSGQADTSPETSSPAPQGRWVQVGGDAIQRQAHSGTRARFVSCGDDLFVHYSYNRGYPQSTGIFVRSADGGPFERLFDAVNVPLFVFACGPGDTLYAVDEEHTVTGSFPNAQHWFAYRARRLEGDTWVDLGLIREGRDGAVQPRVLSDGTDVYFADQSGDGMHLWVLEGQAFAPLAGAHPIPGTTSRVAGREEDFFDDGRVPWFSLVELTNGVGTARVLSLDGRVVTEHYEGPIDFNFDRRFLARDGRLYAHRVDATGSGLVTFPEREWVASVPAPRQIGAIGHAPGGFAAVVFDDASPDHVVGTVMHISPDGELTDLGRELADGTDPVWSKFFSQYQRLFLFPHRGGLHALMDYYVAAGGAGWTDLVAVRHEAR